MSIRGSRWPALLSGLVCSSCSLQAGGLGTAASDPDAQTSITPPPRPRDPGEPWGAAPGARGGDELDEATDVEEDGKAAASANGRDPDAGASAVEADAGQVARCDPGLRIVVRDFTEEHPDFDKTGTVLAGIVERRLGSDKKPVFAVGRDRTFITNASLPTRFEQWYRDVPGVNLRLSETITLIEPSDGLFLYDNTAFFPIDGEGFGNGPTAAPLGVPLIDPLGITPDHNYLFTTEAHLRFTYRGGETLTFRGDDDVWIFINERLAIDLGGMHPPLIASVALDAEAERLGISKGERYALDIFHAERHRVESNYSFATTIDLSCIENVDAPL